MDSMAWAMEEFGHARLGDARRVARLVTVAAGAVEQPSGHLSRSAGSAAERTAAYRLMRNEEVVVDEVSSAARASCIERSRGFPFVYVAEDGSSLALPDADGSRGTGVVGTHKQGARGFIVMNAVVMARDGTPLGVGGQRWWAREEKPLSVDHHKRGPEEKETRHWVELAESVAHDFDTADGPRPWFQFDRGGDAWYVLDEAVQRGWWLTVRAAKDRRLDTPRGAPRRYLRSEVANAPVMARFTVEVPRGHGRVERAAVVEVRACAVTLRLQDDRTSKTWPRTIWAVLAREVGASAGVEPLDWLLLTTRPVRDAEDALDVVIGYRLRWRVEEFHRTWKSAGCDVELTQLESAHGIQLWATILASVAIRILRVMYLSRTSPELPATVEFTDLEIEAAYLLNRAQRPRTTVPTIAEVTYLIACLGGHAPSRRGRAPGATVLARGLARHAVAVETMQTLIASGKLLM